MNQSVIEHYLFDWGDTLMVDFPNQIGPMCDWAEVKVVEGALECLTHLSKISACHLATNAEDSTEQQIRLALKRAGLSDYIQTIFCRENLGVGKTHSDYYPKIANKLNIKPSNLTMVGDSLERDILPAQKAGLKAIWFNPQKLQNPLNVYSVVKLTSIS